MFFLGLRTVRQRAFWKQDLSLSSYSWTVRPFAEVGCIALYFQAQGRATIYFSFCPRHRPPYLSFLSPSTHHIDCITAWRRNHKTWAWLFRPGMNSWSTTSSHPRNRIFSVYLLRRMEGGNLFPVTELGEVLNGSKAGRGCDTQR